MTISPEAAPAIPDEWWNEAGMLGFEPRTRAYPSNSTSIVPISEIEPPARNVGVPFFDRERMISVLREFAQGAVVFPIEVNELPSRGQYRYRVYHGMHRFYASIRAGYKFIPVVVVPIVDLNKL